MRFLAFIGAIAIVVVIAAGVYLFGGFYNVAASVNDVAIVDWPLNYVRDASIRRHASGTAPIKLDDPETIRAGAPWLRRAALRELPRRARCRLGQVCGRA